MVSISVDTHFCSGGISSVDPRFLIGCALRKTFRPHSFAFCNEVLHILGQHVDITHQGPVSLFHLPSKGSFDRRCSIPIHILQLNTARLQRVENGYRNASLADPAKMYRQF